MTVEEMKIGDKAEFLIAVRDYKCDKRVKRVDGMDYWASDRTSDEKVLLRSIEPQGKGSGFVNISDVKSMVDVMKRKDCHSGVLVSKRFTEAATQEMHEGNIQKVSDEYMPPVKPENVLLTINGCIDDLCKVKCGAIPQVEADCKGRLKESLCRVRSISDDALFHFERGWMDLMKSDLRQLLSISKSKRGCW